MFKDYPGEIYAARKDSPMILGIGEGENFLASDVPAILQYTRKVIYMDNYEMVRLTPDAVEVYDLNGDVNEKPVTEITWDAEAAEKGLGVNIHASIDGTVADITQRYIKIVK
jgi:glucosamine--fructose-6-phosphate aminotransferase (isomerizing)